MKKFIILAFIGLLFLQIKGQESQNDSIPEYWTKGATFGFQFTQSAFYQWVAGGDDSYTYAGLSKLFLNYEKDNIDWKNTLDVNYGMIKQGDDPLIKSDDRVEFNSIVAIKAAEKWGYAGQINMRSQFSPGYVVENEAKKRISDLLAPAYLTFSIGLDYSPKKDLDFLISPLTNKNTIVLAPSLSEVGAFGVDPGDWYRAEYGGLLGATWKQKLMKNIELTTNLRLFSNYLEKPQNIDVNWDMLLVFTVNKYINFNITAVMIYDDDVAIPKDRDGDGSFESEGKGMQLKEIFALGIIYTI